MPEGACMASSDSLSETSDWLDIKVRLWDTKVMPHPVFLILLGPDKIAVGKTTNQIRWQFSTVSNYCYSKGGSDKINQTLGWFSYSWDFFSSSSWRHFTQPVFWIWMQGEHSWNLLPSSEQNTRVDLWAGLQRNSDSLLFMMFCRKVWYPAVRTAWFQLGFYKRGYRLGWQRVRQLL